MRTLKKIWIATTGFVRLFFHFRKPAFSEIDVNDWVFAEKPLLLLRWKMRRRYGIYIPGMAFYSSRRTGFYLISLPAGLTELTIILRSGWRKQVYYYSFGTLPMPADLLTDLLLKSQLARLQVIDPFDATVDCAIQAHIPQQGCHIPIPNAPIIALHVDPFRYHQ